MSRLADNIQKEIDKTQGQYASGLISGIEKLTAMIDITNNMLESEINDLKSYLFDADTTDYHKATVIRDKLLFIEKVKKELCFYLEAGI
jgi:hypothetical protein